MNTFVPEKSHIDDVKRDLPPVRVRFNGQQWWGRVTGRSCKYASVCPHTRTRGNRVETIMGPIVHFSWDAVCRAVVNGTELNFDD
jgi:hypothetical protein